MGRYQLRLQDCALRDVAFQLGISLPALARRIECGERTIYRLDAGDTHPSPDTIAALMAVSGWQFDRLFRIADTANRPEVDDRCHPLEGQFSTGTTGDFT